MVKQLFVSSVVAGFLMQSGAPYPRWNYLARTIKDTRDRQLTEKLDSLGEAGWELVMGFEAYGDHLYIFKRPRGAAK